MSTPHLPTEILLYIISLAVGQLVYRDGTRPDAGHAHELVALLKSAALVHSSWTQAAQVALFETTLVRPSRARRIVAAAEVLGLQPRVQTIRLGTDEPTITPRQGGLEAALVLLLESFPLQSLELIGVQLDKLPPTGWRGSNSALRSSFRAHSRTKTWQFRHQKYFFHTTSTPLSTRISRCTFRPAPVIFHSQDAGGARLWGQLNSPRRHYGVRKLSVNSSTTSRRCRPRGNISPQPPQSPTTRPSRPSARASLGAGDKRRSTTLDKFTIIGTPRPSPRPRSGPGLPPHSPANPP